MKYHIFKSNTQILIIFPQFLMVLTLNMHKNVKRNGKNGLQYFLFFKKTKYVFRIRFFYEYYASKTTKRCRHAKST